MVLRRAWPGASDALWCAERRELPRRAYGRFVRASRGKKVRSRQLASTRREISDCLHSSSRWFVGNGALSSAQHPENRHCTKSRPAPNFPTFLQHTWRSRGFRQRFAIDRVIIGRWYSSGCPIVVQFRCTSVRWRTVTPTSDHKGIPAKASLLKLK